MNSRKFPRTMDSAFGPYNRSSQCVIYPMRSKPHEGSIARVLVIAVVVFALISWWIA